MLNMYDCCVGSSEDDLLITVVSNDTSQPSLPTGIVASLSLYSKVKNLYCLKFASPALFCFVC